MKPVLLGLALLGFVTAASASGTKYDVKVSADKRIDFAQIRTYAWMGGWPAFDPNVDWQIEAFVDRELTALGLTRRLGEPCDAVLMYVAIRRTDVDVKSKVSPETGLRDEYPVGTIVVRLLDPRSRREIFRGQASMALAQDPATIRTQIRSAIAQIFAKYPDRKP
jgi:hypothetical protein